MRTVKNILSAACLFGSTTSFAQQEPVATNRPDSGLFSVEAYAEAFYLYDSNRPAGGTVPYFVSFNRHNEFNINLAYVAGRYTSERVRGVIMPGFGTFMNANYATEPTTLKHLVEANVGVKLFPKKGIWLDVGVLPSPYTNETAISMDQPTLTRSFAPEYVPYYVSGARLLVPLSAKVRLYGYVINGWQQMQDLNSTLAIGSWLEYKPNSKLSINWNTYLGDERSVAAPMNRMRHFQDLYVLYAPEGNWWFTASAYMGWQERVQGDAGSRQDQWWQANATARYAIATDRWIYGRVETFNDPHSVVSTSPTGLEGSELMSGTLGYDANVTSMVKLRFEARYFGATDDSYIRDEAAASDGLWFVAGFTARFK